jgi:hypothetical protein
VIAGKSIELHSHFLGSQKRWWDNPRAMRGLLTRKQIGRLTLALVALLLFFLLACRTADLIGSLGRNSASPNTGASDQPSAQSATRAPTKRGPNDPNAFQFIPQGTPHCTAGEDTASLVTGQILENGAPVVAQKVQASSGPGAEPISDEPAESDESGNYQVTFVCDGGACDGAFWVWLIDADFNQVSPFVEFVFDKNCRHGTLDFASP